jgi:hypothetical protein
MKRVSTLLLLIALAVGMCPSIATRAGADETEVVYLSGRGKDDAVPWEFYCTKGRRSGRWTTIAVPSNWELQGFGSYNYGHDRPKADERGIYRRRFGVPRRWRNKRIFLVFEGVMTEAKVTVNGRSAGPVHHGGFYRFKYEITDLVRRGENRLEVAVSKVSADPSVEAAERQADYWVFGGIYRPVYLEVVPQDYIEWVAIDARADGQFLVEVYSQKTRSPGSPYLHVRITGPGLDRPWVIAGGIDAADGKASLEAPVLGIRPWTAETPNVYQAEIRLGWHDQSERDHTVTRRFGFRTFEVRPGDGLYLNGRKIRLKGVNRHCFWPDSGRCLSEEISYADVRLIREMNMNAVRMSHYPPDQHFLDACDELGLYVLDELAGWQKPPYNSDIGKKLVREMVPRDVCHPCILFWDNGNEGGWNRELDDQFALYDPQNRTVLHPWENFNGIDTDHYESYASTQKKLASGTLFMPTEFLHGLYDGGHGAGLNDCWNAMLASPMGAGGFLWVLADEGVVRTDKNGKIDTDGNHAPDGIVGPYRQKEASFYTIKEIWSPVQVAAEAVRADFDGTVKVKNGYDFTNLKDCVFETRLADFPAPDEGRNGHETFFRHAQPGPDVSPQGTGTLDLGLPTNWRDADALYLTACDRQRCEIWTWSWDLRPTEFYEDKYVRTIEGAAGRSEVRLLEDEDPSSNLEVTAGDTVAVFSTAHGRLARIIRGRRSYEFGGGPRLVGGGAVGGGRMEPNPPSDDGTVRVEITFDDGNVHYAHWKIHPGGWVLLEYECAFDGDEKTLFGVDFPYPEDKMRSMRWLGRGPYRVWKNRLKGGVLDVWSNQFKDHVPGVTWDFPEFKGYYKDWRWVVFETAEGPITVINATEDLFLGVYRPNGGPEPAKTRLEYPWHGISFLHGIPAIGMKFQRPEALGPESQKNRASGTYRGKVWFHFGE